MNRRELLRLFGSAAALTQGLPSSSRAEPAPVPTAPKALPWPNASILGLQAAMGAGQVTARQLCEQYLGRIEAVNLKGPQLRAILEVNPDAIQIASALDLERKEKGPRGPLHGIPVVLKDNIETGDLLQTTAGSLALSGVPAKNDAFLVARLRAAGAVVLAKANLSEWANIRSTGSTSGWSARGGFSRNPYALDRSPLGSSSGSGIAVAADLCTVSIGTETDGSIHCPCSVMGLVGLKPTVGLISRAGIIPISPSQDTAGPMTRTVEDAAILLGILAGDDAEDPATKVAGRKAVVDYAPFLRADGLKGARIGVVESLSRRGPAIGALLAQAVADLKQQGAILVDPVELKIDALDDPELEVLLFELKASMETYLKTRRPLSGLKSLADLVAFNEKNAAQELGWFDQDLFIKAAAKGPLTDKAYRKALEGNHRRTRAQGIDAVVAKHKLDALIAPAMGLPGLIDPLMGDHFSGSATGPAAIAGYPSLSVPMGNVAGLPVGLLFFGPAWTEGTLLKLGYAYERASKRRTLPTFAATVTPRQ
jgi:amidase